MSRGTLWHNVLEGHYRVIWSYQRGEVNEDQVAELLQRNADEWLTTNGEQTDEQELVAWMYTGYVEQWGFDAHWEIVAVEHNAEVALPTPTGGRSRLRLKIKIDLVVKQDGHLWVVDHKSGKDLPKGKQLDINDQFGLYTWGLRQMGKKVFGSLHNAARTHRNVDQTKHFQPLEERFKRTRLVRSDAELTTVATEAYKTMKITNMFKPGEAPRSPDDDRCGWRCDYTDACLAGRKGLDEEQFLRDLGYVQDFTRH